MSRPLREASIFLALIFSMALGVALAIPHANINKMLSALLPVTGVIIITFAATPRGKRRELWASFGLMRSGKRMWPFALIVPMILAGSAYAVAVAVGVADLREINLTSAGVADWTLNLFVSLGFMTLLFLGEEIGWRGYLLPRVQQLTSRRRAAVVTGFIHGCFHLPLILIATTYDAHGSRWFVAPMVVATITMAGVFYAYLWDMSGTVWPVAMGHAAVNFMFGLGASAVVASSEDDLAYVAGEAGLATFAVVTIATVVLLTRAKVWRTGKPLPANAVEPEPVDRRVG
jgi:membrane protease YdiL (CAAX protease family)